MKAEYASLKQVVQAHFVSLVTCRAGDEACMIMKGRAAKINFRRCKQGHRLRVAIEDGPHVFVGEGCKIHDEINGVCGNEDVIPVLLQILRRTTRCRCGSAWIYDSKTECATCQRKRTRKKVYRSVFFKDATGDFCEEKYGQAVYESDDNAAVG